MKRILIIANVTILCFLIFESCNNDIENLNSSTQHINVDNEMLSDATISSDYILKDGAIHFKDIETFKRNALDLNKISFEIKKRHPEFQSMFDINNRILNSISEETKKKSLGAISKENERYLTLTNGIFKPRMKGSISSILNSEGLFYIGKILYYYQDDQESIILTGEKKEIENIKIGIINKRFVISKPDQNTTKTNSNSRKASSCANMMLGQASMQVNGSTISANITNLGYGYNVYAGKNYLGDDQFHHYAYMQTFCDNWITTGNSYQPYRTNYTTGANYKATLTDCYGNLTNITIEPDYGVNTFDLFWSTSDFVGFLLVSQTDLNNGYPNIILEPRIHGYNYINDLRLRANGQCP